MARKSDRESEPCCDSSLGLLRSSISRVNKSVVWNEERN